MLGKLCGGGRQPNDLVQPDESDIYFPEDLVFGDLHL
jgi:hypothetical protein